MLTSHSHLNMKIFNESDIRPENYFPFVYKIMNYDLVGWQAHRLGLWGDEGSDSDNGTETET